MENTDEFIRIPEISQVNQTRHVTFRTEILTAVDAIDQKKWQEARKLSKDLIYYDMERFSYRELYQQLNTLVHMADKHVHKRRIIRRRKPVPNTT